MPAFAALVIVLSLVLFAPLASGQEWARKMFNHTSHDFLGVARGSKVQHVFPLRNLYQEGVHISGVRSSCGCTSAEIAKDTLLTYEEGAIIATFNTRAFTGERGATLTVTFDKPYPAEVQLNVSGYIRTDVVLHPTGVEFGSVDFGDSQEKKIQIDYAGRSDWQITAIKSPNPSITAEAVQTNRGNNSVSYELLVRLAPDAPLGYLKEQLIIVTNDRRETQLPVDVEGQIVAPVTVSPASLFLGVLESGQKVTKQLIVRAKRPFRILAIDSPSGNFQFKTNDTAKLVHLIPVTFTAGDRPGKVSEKIRIQTDLGDDVVTECLAYAQVTVPAETSSKPDLAVPAAATQLRSAAKPVGALTTTP